MINKSIILIVFITILISKDTYAQSNVLLPLITYDCGDLSALISRLHLGEGLNPICTTPLGSKIYANVNNGKIQNYIVKDQKERDVNIFPKPSTIAKKGDSRSNKCPLGTIMNCGCIPKSCFCETPGKKTE